MDIYVRCCPECGEDIHYKDSWTMKRATELSTRCHSCITRERNINKHSVLQEHIDTIAQMFSEGHTPNAIANHLGVNRMTVVRALEKDLGLSVQRTGPRVAVDWVDETHIRCRDCRKIKDVSLFYRRSKNSKGYIGRCASCTKERESEKRLGRDVPWNKKLKSIETSALSRGYDFNLTEKYIDFLWKIQEGTCAYTEVPLDRKPKSGLKPDSISFDRVDNQKGYIIGNVVICSKRSNSIKHDMTLDEFEVWMPVWHRRLVSLMGRIQDGWKE